VLFWPTSDAEIDGMRPTFYLHYDGSIPDQQRIEQVIAWLKLPPATDRTSSRCTTRSRIIPGTIRPDSEQTADAVHHVDALVGTWSLI